MKTNKMWNSQYTILFIQNAILNTSFYMISTALSKYLVNTGMTVTVAGTIIGAMPMASMMIRPVSGFICDHFSKKRLMILFLVLNCLCVTGYGFTSSEAVYLLLRIVHGISFGITTTISMALISEHIPEGRMGEGLGYFSLTLTLAMAVGPGLGLAISRFAGNRVMFLFAGACVLLSVISSLFLKEEVQRPIERDKKLHLRLSDFFAKEVLLYAVIIYALSSVNGIESSYIALFGAKLGIENIGWYFTVSAVILLFSRTFSGKLTDKKGLGAVLYPGLAIVISALLLLGFANSANKMLFLVLAAILKALGVGALQPALQAATVSSVEPGRRGAATSTFYVGTDLGQASSPILAGKMIDASGYSMMYRLYTIPLLIVGGLFFLVTVRRKRKMR